MTCQELKYNVVMYSGIGCIATKTFIKTKKIPYIKNYARRFLNKKYVV